MKHLSFFCFLTFLSFSSLFSLGGEYVSLDSCRNLALKNNKQIKIAEEQIKSASFTRSAAKAAYLPGIDFTGVYMYNQHRTSILSEDAYLPVFSFDPQTGSYVPKVVTADGKPVINPQTGQPVFSEVALLPKSAFSKDTHNIFGLGFTLTQPIYMGGEIRALNKIAQYGVELRESLRRQAETEVVYAVDEAYWTVVSLSEKLKLAKKYCDLIEELRRNVQWMYDAGVATQSDILQVDVRYNEASLDLTRVENGLALSRMALAEICGLPIDASLQLREEVETSLSDENLLIDGDTDMQQIFRQRNDLSAMRTMQSMLEGKEKVAFSSMLPKVGLTASYIWANPNVVDGFENRFAGGFHLGVALNVPLIHWGGNLNKYKAAKAETYAQSLAIQDAEEKITLQVRQARFKFSEAFKTYEKTKSGLKNADANMRNAEDGFKEGVLTMTDVNMAQTAWVKAYSENIDAEIAIRLCKAYLSKVMGL